MSVAADRRLGAILIDAKVLAKPSLADALDRQRRTGHRLGTVLVDMGLADERTIVAALAVQRDLPPGHRSAGSEPSERVQGPDDHGQRILQAIVSDAVRAGASDIHLELVPGHTKLRYRVDGVLTEAASLPLRSGAAAVRRAEHLAGAPRGSRRPFHPFTMTVDGCALRVIVTASATFQGERVRLRVSSEEAASRARLDQLGMPSDIQTSLTTLLQESSGLIIIAGRRGSGRTTTAYAAMAEVDTPQRSIVMLQRSVPCVLQSVSQIEIGSQPIGPAILAAAVGQDADGVLIDDLEGAGAERAAIRMAQRGMLVVMTLTAVDMAATRAHFLGTSDRRSLLDGTRHAIVHQRLERRDRTDVGDGRIVAFELVADEGIYPDEV